MELQECNGRVKEEWAALSTKPGRLAKHLKRFRTPRHAVDTVAAFVSQCMKHVDTIHVPFVAQFAAKGWDVGPIQWDAFGEFNAKACLTAGRHDIHIAVEAPAGLLSLAHELDSTASWPVIPRPSWERAAWSVRALSRKWRASSLTVWLDGLPPATSVSAKAQARALDAVHLLYYHEASHVMFGHLGAQIHGTDQVRAIEFDADFNAGSLFAKALLQQGLSDVQAVERLTEAALLLCTAFRAFDRPSPEYHFPTVRAVAYVQGGIFLLLHGFPQARRQTLQLQWEQLATLLRDAYHLRLTTSSLAHVAGDTADLVADMHALQNTTIPTRVSLKDGALKGRAVVP